MATYPGQFDNIGKFPGEYHIVLEEESHPVIHAPRKCPTLKRWVKARVRRHGTETRYKKDDGADRLSKQHSRFKTRERQVASVYRPKRSDQIIKRCHHKTPKQEEITYKFAGSRFYSKLDAKNGYWFVVLEESTKLTTFNSPFGRYCFLRIPFGLVMSQNVFQHRMDQVLEKCSGMVSIVDDIFLCEKTEGAHDRNLYNLMEVVKRHGLVFNGEKCQLKSHELNSLVWCMTKMACIQTFPRKQNWASRIPRNGHIYVSVHPQIGGTCIKFTKSPQDRDWFCFDRVAWARFPKDQRTYLSGNYQHLLQRRGWNGYTGGRILQRTRCSSPPTQQAYSVCVKVVERYGTIYQETKCCWQTVYHDPRVQIALKWT